METAFQYGSHPPASMSKCFMILVESLQLSYKIQLPSNPTQSLLFLSEEYFRE